MAGLGLWSFLMATSHGAGLAFLRQGWITLDILWSLALAVAGVLLIL